MKELGEHRSTNYTSKNNRSKSAPMFSCQRKSIYAVFSQDKPSQALELLTFDPRIPTGWDVWNDSAGNEVTWKFGSSKCLLKHEKSIFIFVFV